MVLTEGIFLRVLAEKTWCWLGVIPVLVFDCFAFQFKEGISGLFQSAFFYGYMFR
jgi:hypothetical protein